ncbi:unnamed protein product [Pleuronectes platessa]|uniref:Uncharacterized protein n=1 Tax=Pleuronectes platessa TaxID=8262 RepID=A0A9N7Y8J4_PLEPL|nr:unnamed protein product [Pleuronectes platessa]
MKTIRVLSENPPPITWTLIDRCSFNMHVNWSPPACRLLMLVCTGLTGNERSPNQLDFDTSSSHVTSSPVELKEMNRNQMDDTKDVVGLNVLIQNQGKSRGTSTMLSAWGWGVGVASSGCVCRIRFVPLQQQEEEEEEEEEERGVGRGGQGGTREEDNAEEEYIKTC